MVTIETRKAKSWIKCCCCSEQIRTCDSFLQVLDNGKPVRGERYCEGCECIAHENNPVEEEDDGERHLRAMEDYAAYQAAGCTGEYYTDRDAGYAH